MTPKKFSPMLLLALLSLIAWQSCTKTELQKGAVEFGINPLVEEALKSTEINRQDVVGALVSIKSDDGTLEFDKLFLNFYSFGESFVTEKLQLDIGQYLLSEFLLVDSSRNILWATPLKGSELANLVDNPLPIRFKIEPGNTTMLHPEVVWVGSHHPGEFGYVSFEVEFVRELCISINYKPDCSDWYFDSICFYDSTCYCDTIPFCDSIDLAWKGDFNPLYPGKLIITSGNEVIKTTNLIPGNNQVDIPKGYDMYNLVVIDCFRDKCFDASFGLEELKHFSCINGETLCIDCTGGSTGGRVITPENLFHPTIDQGVFGRLLTTVSDSICMEECAEDCIWPLVREIHLFRIDAYEDVFKYVDETEYCRVIPLINKVADLVVMPNSDGYFQAELEVGTYLYMVLTETGFYIDLYLSSRPPGILHIGPGEVEIANVVVQPCYYF